MSGGAPVPSGCRDPRRQGNLSDPRACCMWPKGEAPRGETARGACAASCCSAGAACGGSAEGAGGAASARGGAEARARRAARCCRRERVVRAGPTRRLPADRERELAMLLCWRGRVARCRAEKEGIECTIRR